MPTIAHFNFCFGISTLSASMIFNIMLKLTLPQIPQRINSINAFPEMFGHG